ncbi:MAG: hypothetical protein M0C28_36845 [Candidatus Moduliflexus flocculans]|nr:hypothetical protein [Candidatus Moduliflexus flocculans]
MEVIEFPGYIEEEKLEIADRYLIPRQIEENGIDELGLRVRDRRAAAHHPRIHLRSGRAQPGARDRARLPQGGAPEGGRKKLPDDHHARR